MLDRDFESDIMTIKNLHDMQERKEGERMNHEMNALKGALTERNKTYKECAKNCGMSITTFNNKINGRLPFTCWEAKQISAFLDLSTPEIVRIFLSQNLHDMQEHASNAKA